MDFLRLARAACVAAGLAVSAIDSPHAHAAAGEPPITLGGVEGDYLRALHTRIHEGWAVGFIRNAGALPPSNPLNDPRRRTVVLFAIRWDGTVAGANLVASSGAPQFDKAALDVVRRAGPYPVPPVGLFSDDGVAHFRWALARDHRLCGGAELHRREDPLEDALPRLLVQSRVKEALLRVVRQMKSSSSPDALTLFARMWLRRPLLDPVADVHAAAILARRGDARQIDRLTAGLRRKDLAEVAGKGLAALKVDVCALVNETLLTGTATEREAAMIALQEGAPDHSGAIAAPCMRAITTTAADGTLPSATRVLAIEALARTPSGDATAAASVVPLLAAALKDRDPGVRAAAILATAQPGGGRPALYRLLPLMRDRAPQVRAAAAVAIVRATGELGLDHLQVVIKDKDPSPAVALAAELGRLTSPGSAAFLGRLLKHPAAEVRSAASRALVTRSDPAARSFHANLGGKDPPSPAAARPLAAPNDLARPFRDLMEADEPIPAAEWLVAQLERLSAQELVAALGAWLDRRNPAADKPPVSAVTP
jgi:TonB family protein